MKVTFYVNAMVLMESAHSRVLCDPWITFDDKSDSGFYNFPKVTMGRKDVAGIRPDFIYITHTHPDHFDPPTLTLFPKDTPILVSYYEQNFTEREVRKLGFTDVRVSEPGVAMELNCDDCCWIEPSANNPEVDSIAAFRLGGQTAVNANDNVFHEGQCADIRDRIGGVDIGLLPSGAHGPFPMYFDNLSPEEKLAQAERRAENQEQAFCRYVEAFRPRWVVPIAGGIVCAGDKARQYRYSGIRPRSEIIDASRRRLDFEPVLLSEGCSFDFETGERHGDYVESTYDTEKTYLDTLACLPGKFGPQGEFFVAPNQRTDLSRLLSVARRNMWKWQERKNAFSDRAFFFDVGDERLYRLSMADQDVSRVAEADIGDPEYDIFRLPYELLLGMLTRHYVWSNVNTQYMSFHRHADDMDPNLQLMINFLQV